MRTLRFALPLVLTLIGFAGCGEGGLVPSDAGPGTGGVTGSGAVSGSGAAGPGSGGQGLGGDNLGGAGGASATGGTGGGETGTGGSDPGCTPRVHLLIQRSGGMFNFPSAEDNWWDAVSAALDGEGGLLEEFGGQMELSASVFTKVAEEACPLATSVPAPLGAGDLVDVLASEAEAYFELTDPENPDARKVDAPVVEAVEAATDVLADAENAYIVLIMSGIPDSCDTNDSQCTGVEVLSAVAAAHAEGIQTRVVYLSSDDIEAYPQAVANAGVGAGVGEPPSLVGCGTFEYSDTPGTAPFGEPEDVGGVEAALSSVLGDIVLCN